ncbi:MAG TPA: DUF3710 domain-containing protein [Streptosporangiaceae bacterium]
MFRRRRGEPEYVEDDAADWEDEEADEAEEAEPEPVRAGGGPWDAGEPYPERDRVDLGSLRVPVGPGHEIQLVMAEQHGAWVTARYGESEIQVQAFAAARNDALWDDVREEIVAEVEAAGGRSWESEGLFGTELEAEVPVEPGDAASGLRTVRFVGVDGPRWFLRGVFSGAAAENPAAAAPLEAVMREVVVVRGEHPVPPRDLLELRLPPEAAQAIAEQQAEQAEQEGRDWGDINPFDRGPEFTETRLFLGGPGGWSIPPGEAELDRSRRLRWLRRTARRPPGAGRRAAGR